MGTRADFYVGRGEQAEWLGSIAWDGYPHGAAGDVLQARSEEDFRHAVATLMRVEAATSTTPEDGWPWPWEDSRTTDYAYAFDGDRVHASRFGSAWFDPTKGTTKPAEGPDAIFPDMTERQRVTLGPRSGITVVGIKKAEESQKEGE